jgi:hypothetical protein
MTTLSQDHHLALRHVDREAVGAALQPVLIVLIDLALLGKQLHWGRPGVFAASDVRAGSMKRVASAVGESATAVRMVHQYLGAAGSAPATARPGR